MASISSLMSSSSSSIYGSRSTNIISGLASGLDTESMIEGMVQDLKLKMQGKKQEQTLLQWQQEAYRSISDQLVSLSTKYTSYTSSTNLMSSSFFSSSIITALGENADKISATGSTTSSIEVLSVNNLAQTETITFEGLNGVEQNNAVAGTKGVDLSGDVDVSQIAGKTLAFEYGNKTFSVTFDSNKEYNTLDDVVKEFNEQLEGVTITSSSGDTITMSDKLQAKNDGGKFTLEFLDEKESNTLELTTSSSDELVEALHLKEEATMKKGESIASSEVVSDENLFEKKDAGEVLAGTYFNVTYNGKQVTISMPEKDSKEYNEIFGTEDDPVSAEDAAKNMTEYLQEQIDQEFGKGRVTVQNIASKDEDGKISTFMPEFTVSDENATLSIDSGSQVIVGKGGIFGLDRGASNRVNTERTLEELGYINEDGTSSKLGAAITAEYDKSWKLVEGETDLYQDEDGNFYKKGDGDTYTKVDEDGNALYALEINGVRIGEYSKESTLDEIMNDINANSKAGVNVKYSETANQFVFTATHGGAGGQIAIDATTEDGATNLAAELFGSVQYGWTNPANGTTYDKLIKTDTKSTRITEDGQAIEYELNPEKNTWTLVDEDERSITAINGKDASMTVTINGTKKTLTSGSNTFNIDGFSITANGTFTEGEPVTFNKQADTDKVVDAVKAFVEEYNTMLEDLGELYTTQPDTKNNYEPLTDDQKAELTDKQIEEYEAKAKEGILFNDSILTSLASDLRFLFSGLDMDAIGISTSSTASDRGKLSLDESKLREALDGNPEAVQQAFTAPIERDDEGNVTSGGAMIRLKEVLDEYAATTGATKGLLIEKAGSQFSPVALFNNDINSEIEEIDEEIDEITDQLNNKIDFYTSKFTQLEMLISQMNSQSSYLASMTGGY